MIGVLSVLLLNTISALGNTVEMDWMKIHTTAQVFQDARQLASDNLLFDRLIQFSRREIVFSIAVLIYSLVGLTFLDARHNRKSVALWPLGLLLPFFFDLILPYLTLFAMPIILADFLAGRLDGECWDDGQVFWLACHLWIALCLLMFVCTLFITPKRRSAKTVASTTSK